MHAYGTKAYGDLFISVPYAAENILTVSGEIVSTDTLNTLILGDSALVVSLNDSITLESIGKNVSAATLKKLANPYGSRGYGALWIELPTPAENILQFIDDSIEGIVFVENALVFDSYQLDTPIENSFVLSDIASFDYSTVDTVLISDYASLIMNTHDILVFSEQAGVTATAESNLAIGSAGSHVRDAVSSLYLLTEAAAEVKRVASDLLLSVEAFFLRPTTDDVLVLSQESAVDKGINVSVTFKVSDEASYSKASLRDLEQALKIHQYVTVQSYSVSAHFGKTYGC